jgi:hypothetical protein
MSSPWLMRALLLGTAALVSLPMSAAAKCAAHRNDAGQLVAMPPPALIVDGRQTTAGDMETTLSPHSVQALYILCWNPADSMFYSSHGGTGSNVIWVVTSNAVERVIAELHRASEAGSGIQAEPAGSVSASAPDASRATDERILVERSADGAQLLATLQQGAMVVRCALDVGEAPATSETRRSCTFSVATSEKFALRTDG